MHVLRSTSRPPPTALHSRAITTGERVFLGLESGAFGKLPVALFDLSRGSGGGRGHRARCFGQRLCERLARPRFSHRSMPTRAHAPPVVHRRAVTFRGGIQGRHPHAGLFDLPVRQYLRSRTVTPTVAVDKAGNIYLTGTANSTLATTPNAPQGKEPSGPKIDGSAFAAELNPSRGGAAQLVFSTFIGGSGGGPSDARSPTAAARSMSPAGRIRPTFSLRTMPPKNRAANPPRAAMPLLRCSIRRRPRRRQPWFFPPTLAATAARPAPESGWTVRAISRPWARVRRRTSRPLPTL